MGAGAVGPVVADSSPLIHLAEIGLLGLLRMFEAVHAPGAVWSETVGKGLAENAIAQLYDLSSLFVTRAIVDLVIDELRKSSGP